MNKNAESESGESESLAVYTGPTCPDCGPEHKLIPTQFSPEQFLFCTWCGKFPLLRVCPVCANSVEPTAKNQEVPIPEDTKSAIMELFEEMLEKLVELILQAQDL